MSEEFIIAFGLVFVIEGLIWAIFPNLFQKLAVLASDTPEGQLRLSGVMAIAFGVFIVWLVRG
jgi:uncharacterized protein YjeT (DUF2065 family)